MSQNCINNKIQKLNNSFFCGEFNKTRIPKKYKSLGKKIVERKLSQAAYNEITGKFFDIFYNELYYLNKPSYFFLGGFIEKWRGRSGVKTIGKKDENNVRKKRNIEHSIFLIWTDFFSLNKSREIEYIKTKGSSSRTGKIEREWLKKNNYDSLKKL